MLKKMEFLWNALVLVVSWLFHVLLEFTLFIAIDSVAKNLLKSFRHPWERRWIWWMESVVLLVSAYVLSRYNHVTYVLFILGIATFVFAVFHHSTSETDTELAASIDFNNGMLNPRNEMYRSRMYKNIERKIDRQDDFVRRNSYLLANTQSWMTNARNVVKSWISYMYMYLLMTFQGKSKRVTPPGLPNRGMNLCFLNTVLQCLVHVQSNFYDFRKMLQVTARGRPEEYQFFDSYCKLALAIGGQNSLAVIDTFAFRRAASQLCPSLVTDPSSVLKQTQQDAAEFLMWLLSALHNILKNVSLSRNINKTLLTSGVENLNEKERQSLRRECRMLFETAQSMYDEKSVKAVKVLSDLDWLQQQHSERSFISELFSGQMLELREDVARNNLSFGIQTFSVLPVPLSGPRQISGVVYLQDCISDMCAMTDVQLESSPGPKLTSLSTCAGSQANNSSGPKSPSGLGSNNHSYITTITPNRGRSREYRCQMSLRYPPKCLIIQLNRFGQRGRKAKIPVNIPVYGLDLTPALFDQHVTGVPLMSHPNHLYDLAALCVHKGAASTCYGHYIAFCRSGSGHWYRMDDEKVTEVNMVFECNSALVRENAYLLFYVQRNQLM